MGERLDNLERIVSNSAYKHTREGTNGKLAAHQWELEERELQILDALLERVEYLEQLVGDSGYKHASWERSRQSLAKLQSDIEGGGARQNTLQERVESIERYMRDCMK